MIHWLLQRLDEHPSLLAGEAPAGLLAPVEQQRLATISNPKRRRDWLLGRWTGKQLLQALARQDGRIAPLSAITIASDANGAPFTRFGAHSGSGWSLSLSHSRGVAFCAAAGGAGWRLGADIEWIEPRVAGFATDYLTAAELALVAQAGAARDSLITAIWSAKEAALKALRIGLRVDTRAVSCLIAPDRDAAAGWQPFWLAWDKRRIVQELPLPAGGWWRLWQGFVLTLVAQPPRVGTGQDDGEWA